MQHLAASLHKPRLEAESTSWGRVERGISAVQPIGFSKKTAVNSGQKPAETAEQWIESGHEQAMTIHEPMMQPNQR
jgi:hypothetical protein